ncbi:MAG: hypothetical protein Kow0020_07400 [Wenzhouxiangellaceae bacterium]
MDYWSTIWALVRLRAGPQDVPAGRAPLLHGLAAVLVLLLLTTAQSPGNLQPREVVVILGLPPLLAMSLLALTRRRARFEQTVAALYGSAALLGLLQLPALLWPGEPPALLLFIALGALLWSLAVDAHIWRHALEVPWPAGLLVALGGWILQLELITIGAGS